MLKASDVEIFRRVYEPTTNMLWPRPENEHRDFLDAIHPGRPPTYAAEALHRLSTAMHLGAISMELKRPLTWDLVAEAFVCDAAAHALRSRPSPDQWQRRG